MSDILTVTGAAMGQMQQADNALNKAKDLGSREVRDKAQLDKATKGFEALLLQEMMKSMFATVKTEGLMGEDSNQAQIFQGMFQQAVADEISAGDGIGVQEFLAKELTKNASKTEKDK